MGLFFQIVQIVTGTRWSYLWRPLWGSSGRRTGRRLRSGHAHIAAIC